MGLLDKIKNAVRGDQRSLDTMLIEQGAKLRVVEDTYRTEIDKAVRVIRYNPDRRKQAKAKERLKNAYYGLKVTIETYDYLQDVKSENDLASAMAELNGILGDIASLEAKKVRVPQRKFQKRIDRMEGKLDGASGGVLQNIDDVVKDSVIKDLVSGMDVDVVLGNDMDNWGGDFTNTIEKPISIQNDVEEDIDVVPLDDDLVLGNTTTQTKKQTLDQKQEDEYMDDLR